MDSRELATVLAALRYYQAAIDTMPSWPEHRTSLVPGEILDIATNLGAVDPLTGDEIDVLCEKLNFGDDDERA